MMEKDQLSDDEFDFQWQDGIQDVHDHDSSFMEGLFQFRENKMFDNDQKPKSSEIKQQSFKGQKSVFQSHPNQLMDAKIQQNKRQAIMQKEQSFESNLSQNSKDKRVGKQQLYSKVYRQRKKEKYQQLEEENLYLKKRISQLQSQIRDQQIQLNRFKFPPPEKELSIEEFNKEFVDVSISLLNELKSQPKQSKNHTFQNDSYFHKFVTQTFAERGFAGNKKIKILNYHFNQILESIMLDSEKYLSLIYANSESYDKLVLLPQFQPINKVYLEVYESEGDLWKRLKTVNKFLYPISLELNTRISQFYKKYQEILKCSEIIHNFLRQNYLQNIDIARRRFEMQKWFDFYKYGKMIRKLRYQWFQWMKKLASKEEQESKGAKKGSKKKKVPQ